MISSRNHAYTATDVLIYIHAANMPQVYAVIRSETVNMTR